MIGMWGSRRAGKTTFVSALYHEIRRRKEEESDIWKMVGQTDAANELLLRDWERFRSSKFPENTPSDVVAQPLIYEVTRPFGEDPKAQPAARSWSGSLRRMSEWLVRAGADRETITLNLFDPSGEFFSVPNRLIQDDPAATQCRNMLRSSDGLLCFIDPTRSDDNEYFPLVFRNCVLLSKLLNEEAGGSLPVPVAIVVTKADQFPDAFRDPRAFLRSTMGRAAFGALMDYCERREFFAVSSVGTGNVEGKGTDFNPLDQPEPEGVWAPIAWLLDAMNGRL